MRSSSSPTPRAFLPGPFRNTIILLFILTLATTFQGATAHVRLALTHHPHGAAPLSALHPRAVGGVHTPLGNWDRYGAYMVDVAVGTPPQRLSLALSFGTWDTWVPDVALGCERDNGWCIATSFDSAASETFRDALDSRGWFNQGYVDGSSASGHFVNDTLTIGDFSIPEMSMGLATQVDQSLKGILALGYPVHGVGPSDYMVLDALTMQGAIATSAFSLWSDDPRGLSGNLLFGAIDTAKYTGQLQSVSMQHQYEVTLQSMQWWPGGGSTDSVAVGGDELPVQVVLSPGDTVSYLPQAAAEEIWSLADAEYEPEAGMARISCSAGGQDKVLRARLGGSRGPELRMDLADLVLSRETFTQAKSWGDDWCLFGVQNVTKKSLWSLGKPMFLQTYAVFDTVNRQLAVAPTNFDTTSSGVVEFAGYASPIPLVDDTCAAYCSDRSSGGGSYPSDRIASPLLIIIISVCGAAVLVGIVGTIFCCWRQKCFCCRGRRKTADGTAETVVGTGGGQGFTVMYPMYYPVMVYPNDGPQQAAPSGPLTAEKYVGQAEGRQAPAGSAVDETTTAGEQNATAAGEEARDGAATPRGISSARAGPSNR